MNVNDLLVELDRRDTLLANDATLIRELIKENARLREALPSLDAVILWLENGGDPKDAAKELRFYERKIQAALETT